MKKIVLALTVCLVSMCFFGACDRIVSADKLPDGAKQLIANSFNGVDVLSVRKDGLKYDVILVDGTEIEFKSNGKWKEVDCGMNQLPESILPEAISKYLAARFPTNFATHVKYENKRYEVELDNDLDLVFDKSGAFIGADD